MTYMGSLPAGSKVELEISLPPGAGGSALAAVSFADDRRKGGNDSVAVAPGATGRCTVQTNQGVRGLVRVWVDLNREEDSATLTVRAGPNKHVTRTITGDDTWSFTLL